MDYSFNEIGLKNGLSLKIYQNNHLHRGHLRLFFKGGTLYEPAGETGITHLVEHLFFRSLHGMSQRELYTRMESIGATLRGATYRDMLCFSFTFAPEYFTEAFAIISAVFAEQSWSHVNIKKEKAVVCSQITFEGEDSFSEFTMRKYLQGTPIGRLIMGDIRNVMRLSKKKIDAWRRNITQPENACFILAGNLSEKQCQYVHEHLSALQNHTVTPANNETILPVGCFHRTADSDYIFSKAWENADIHISFDVPNELGLHADLLCSIIGQGVGSLLSLALREELALTDKIDAYVEKFTGITRLSINFTVDMRDIEKALLTACERIKACKNEILPRDYAQTICFFTKNQSFLLDDPEELAFQWGWRSFILGENIQCIDDLSLQYSAISLQELTAASKRIFFADNFFVLLNHDRSRISAARLRKTLARCREILSD